MTLANDNELDHTRRLLAELEKRIGVAKTRPVSDANRASTRTLIQTANQLREQMIRYDTAKQRQSS